MGRQVHVVWNFKSAEICLRHAVVKQKQQGSGWPPTVIAMENGNTTPSVAHTWNWPTFGAGRGLCSFNYKRSTIAHFWIPNWQISQTKFLCNFSLALYCTKIENASDEDAAYSRENYMMENKMILDRRGLLIREGFQPFEIGLRPVMAYTYASEWSMSRYGPYLSQPIVFYPGLHGSGHLICITILPIKKTFFIHFRFSQRIHDSLAVAIHNFETLNIYKINPEAKFKTC